MAQTGFMLTFGRVGWSQVRVGAAVKGKMQQLSVVHVAVAVDPTFIS